MSYEEDDLEFYRDIARRHPLSFESKGWEYRKILPTSPQVIYLTYEDEDVTVVASSCDKSLFIFENYNSDEDSEEVYYLVPVLKIGEGGRQFYYHEDFLRVKEHLRLVLKNWQEDRRKETVDKALCELRGLFVTLSDDHGGYPDENYESFSNWVSYIIENGEIPKAHMKIR